MTVLDRLRTWLAWRIHPTAEPDDVAERLEHIELALMTFPLRAEGHDDLLALLDDLGIEPTDQMEAAVSRDVENVTVSCGEGPRGGKYISERVEISTDPFDE